MTIETEAEAFLAHYGKKGMRWGHRQAEGTVSPRQAAKAAKKEARAAEEKEIIGARVRQANRSVKLQQKAMATYMQTTKKGQKAADEAYERAENRLISHPDATTAAKMTHGEKAADNIVMGVTLASVGLFLAGSVGMMLLNKD